MTYKDPETRARVAREWIAARRAEWLASHPCACGAPSTSIIATTGHVPRGCFSWRPERRDKGLADCGARAMCAACKPGSINRPRPARKTGKPAAAKPEVVPAAPKAKRAARPQPASALAEPGFDRKVWREERRRRLGYGLPKDDE